MTRVEGRVGSGRGGEGMENEKSYKFSFDETLGLTEGVPQPTVGGYLGAVYDPADDPDLPI